MNIPIGFSLVPIHPTERMLSEFAGIWAPNLPRSKRDIELAAYNMMLMVAPTPPCGGSTEIESLREQLMRAQSDAKRFNEQLKNATSQYRHNMHKVQEKIKILQREINNLNRDRK